jgi:hypothetical protein
VEAKCPHANGCPLFPLFTRQNLLRAWQIAYCDGAFETCARYKRSLTGQAVPNTLLPNGETLRAPTRKAP